MSNVLGTLVVRMALDAADFNRDLTGASASIQAAGAKMKTIGNNLTMGVTLPVVGAGAAAVAMATDYNASLANIASLGIPTDRIDEFKAAIQDMGIEVGKMPTDLSEGMYQVVSAFGDGSDSLDILEINARAAAAGLATTTEAINLTSAVTKGYGDTSEQAVQHAADLAFETVKLGQTTFPELAASIGTVVPIAASLGVTQEELFGVMATGTGVTGGASEVATQLRGVLQSLMSPTEGMTGLLASMGYESGQAMLDQLGLKGTIDTLVKAAEEAGVPLQDYISSIEGQTLALALAGPQSETFASKLTAMNDVAGAVGEAFDAQAKGVNATGFEMGQVTVKAAVLAQKLGDGLAPVISRVLDFVQPFADKLLELATWFSTADTNTQNMILTFGAILVAVGPILSILGSLATAISVVSSMASVVGVAMPVIGTVLTALGGPITLTVAAVAALALAWDTDFAGMRTTVMEFMAWVEETFPDFVKNMTVAWTSFTDTIGQAGATPIDLVNGSAVTGGPMGSPMWTQVLVDHLFGTNFSNSDPDNRSVQVTQIFNGATDAGTVRMSSEMGLLDALRQIGGR